MYITFRRTKNSNIENGILIKYRNEKSELIDVYIMTTLNNYYFKYISKWYETISLEEIDYTNHKLSQSCEDYIKKLNKEIDKNIEF